MNKCGFSMKDSKTFRDSSKFVTVVSLPEFDRFLTRSFCSNRLIVRITVDFDITVLSLLKVSLNNYLTSSYNL